MSIINKSGDSENNSIANSTNTEHNYKGDTLFDLQ